MNRLNKLQDAIDFLQCKINLEIRNGYEPDEKLIKEVGALLNIQDALQTLHTSIDILAQNVVEISNSIKTI